MECLDNCEFQNFKGKKFLCTLYEDELRCYKENGNVAVIRCKQCIEEKVEYELIEREI
jgi:hypothetical protein